MNLPGAFLRTIEQNFGQRGQDFLEALPELVQEAARRWQLSDIQPVPNLSYNYVAFARRQDTHVVLKVGVPDRELLSEMIALRAFESRASVRLLESDEDSCMFLLERLRPGEILSSLKDDRRETEIAAELMQSLWRQGVVDTRLIQLADWFKGFERLRARFGGGTGPLDERLVDQAESIARDLLTQDYSPTLLHGDLHHFNILSSQRGWLAIDPKGVLGQPGYEIGPYLLNPWVVTGLDTEVAGITRDRIAIFSERLGIPKTELRDWGMAYAALSAWWNLEAGEDWSTAMHVAGILAATRF